jgi:hypothetical protein
MKTDFENARREQRGGSSRQGPERQFPLVSERGLGTARHWLLRRCSMVRPRPSPERLSRWLLLATPLRCGWFWSGSVRLARNGPSFTLLKLETPADAVAASAALVEAVAGGELRPGEAGELSKLIEGFTKAMELHEIVACLEKLEGESARCTPCQAPPGEAGNWLASPSRSPRRQRWPKPPRPLRQPPLGALQTNGGSSSCSS